MGELLLTYAFQLIIAAAISAALSLATSSLLGGPKEVGDEGDIDIVGPMQSVFDETAPLPFLFGRRRVALTYTFSQKVGRKSYIIGVIAGAPICAIHGVYLNNKKVALDVNGNVLDAPWNQGGDYSINIKTYDGFQTEADAELVAAFPDWKATDVGHRIAYVRIIIDTDPFSTWQEVFSAGLPDITVDVTGHPQYDPRNVAHNINDPSTWLASGSPNNPGLHLGNYVVHELGMKQPMSKVDWASVAAAANVCDALRVTKYFGTVKTYEAVTYGRTQVDHESFIPQIGSSCAGGLLNYGNKWVAWAGTFEGPSHPTITPDDYYRSGPNIQPDTRIRNKIVGMRAKFASKEDGWEMRDAPIYRPPTTPDNADDDSIGDIELPFVYSPEQAQRLAKISFMVALYGYPASVETRIDLLNIVANDIVQITDPLADISNETFRVMRCEGTAEVRIEEEVPVTDIWLNFDLRHETASFYAFDKDTEEKEYIPTTGDPAAGTPIPIPGIEPLSSTQIRVVGPGSAALAVSPVQYLCIIKTDSFAGVPSYLPWNGTPIVFNRGNTNNAAFFYNATSINAPTKKSGQSSLLANGATAKVLPSPAPCVLNFRSVDGNIKASLTYVDDANVTSIELLRNTTNNLAGATVHGTYTNAADIPEVTIGPRSDTVYLWTRSTGTGTASVACGPVVWFGRD